MVVSRLHLAAGGEIDVGSELATDLLRVEAGSSNAVVDAGHSPIHLIRDANDPAGTDDAIALGHPVSLASGDHLVLPPSAHGTLRNIDATPAFALRVTLSSFDASPMSVGGDAPGAVRARQRRFEATPAPSVEEQVLIAGDAIAIASPARLAVGRLALAPGASLPVPAGDRVVAVAVESGLLDRAPGDGGNATHLRLSAGTGIEFEVGTGTTWRAGDDGAATVLVLTISPLATGSVAPRTAPIWARLP